MTLTPAQLAARVTELHRALDDVEARPGAFYTMEEAVRGLTIRLVHARTLIREARGYINQEAAE